MKKVITIIMIFGLMIVQAQNVGVNTDTPQATLDIKSDGSTSTTKALKINNSASSNSEILTVTDDGKVGIGTGMPTEKLTLWKDDVIGSQKIQFIIGQSNPSFPSNYDTDVGFIESERHTADGRLSDLHLGTMGNRVLTANYSGNVGIGTTIPTEKLEVAGSVKIVDGTQAAGKVLVSDANGKASWKNVAQYTVKGTIPTNEVKVPAVLDATGKGAIAYTGCYITLPKGDWTVKATSWLAAGGSDLVLPATSNPGFASIFLSTSSTAHVPPTYISNIKSIIINPLYQAGNPTIQFYGTGEIPIRLTSTQTVYLWGYISSDVWNPLPNTADINKAHFRSLNGDPGAYGPYTQFYAVPINYAN